MNKNDDDEERIWKEAYEKTLIDKKYQYTFEISEQRKEILKIEKETAEVQLKKERLLEQQVSLNIRTTEVLWHKANIEYQIAKLQYHTILEQKDKPKEEEKEELIEIALKTSQSEKEVTNLTLYSDSE